MRKLSGGAKSPAKESKCLWYIPTSLCDWPATQCQGHGRPRRETALGSGLHVGPAPHVSTPPGKKKVIIAKLFLLMFLARNTYF